MQDLIILLCLFVPLLIFSVVNFIISKRKNKQAKERLKYTESISSLEREEEELKERKEQLQKECKDKETEIHLLQSSSAAVTTELKKLELRKINFEKDNAVLIATAKEKNNQVLSNYIDLLEKTLEIKENEFDNKIEELEASFLKKENELNKSLNCTKEELEKLKKSRDSLLAAQAREEEVKKNKQFYCLHLSDNDKEDIKILNSVKIKLKQPRILSMLIWSTFFQKPMSDLCIRVLKTTNTVCGIYKITNLKDNKCYIGQSVDVARRWKDHAKCGLGVDTPANNKLYKAMQEDGLWNFSWELLEECPSSLLNEKEKYYIDFYKSKDYGYNSSIGVSK